MNDIEQLLIEELSEKLTEMPGPKLIESIWYNLHGDPEFENQGLAPLRGHGSLTDRIARRFYEIHSMGMVANLALDVGRAHQLREINRRRTSEATRRADFERAKEQAYDGIKCASSAYQRLVEIAGGT